ncbi:MAG: hypothetical protein OSA99_07395 [Acidimicrobiales bacterium]|nr:hypothetical protein [Acidimicrobiales bacterium]
MIVERHRGRAGELHSLALPDDGVRRVWVLEATHPAVVLGSTQSDDVVDHRAAAAAGVEVVRRRSGGGAVWVAPDDPIWVDVVIPRGDPLWTDDVGHAFRPVGRAWSEALETVGVAGTVVHQGAMIRTDWSDLVCFSGTGPGEVLHHGRKIVGISQRRSRSGARFQCAIPRRWEPQRLCAVLREPPPLADLLHVGGEVGEVTTADLVDAFVAAMA